MKYFQLRPIGAEKRLVSTNLYMMLDGKLSIQRYDSETITATDQNTIKALTQAYGFVEVEMPKEKDAYLKSVDSARSSFRSPYSSRSSYW